MSCPDVGWVDLRVTRFTTQLMGDMRSSQTKLALHHYPIKGAHQMLVLEAIFKNWDEYGTIQDYVRKHQLRALRTVEQPEVVLYWPERGIENWSGVIRSIEAGDERFNVAPRTSLEIQLIDSMISQKTWTSSFGEDFSKFFETSMNLLDPELVPPPVSNAPGGGDTEDGDSFFDDYLGGILGY